MKSVKKVSMGITNKGIFGGRGHIYISTLRQISGSNHYLNLFRLFWLPSTLCVWVGGWVGGGGVVEPPLQLQNRSSYGQQNHTQ